ncbi:MAG: hypothetical protein Q4G34_03945 [Micrococcus sp.]|nr:hypothetical protein [Micrococcus sp.]
MVKKSSFLGRMAGTKAMDVAMNTAFDKDGNPSEGFQRTLLWAIKVQRPLVLANLRRLHRRHPEDSPAELADRLSSQYLNTVTGAGAAVGGTAIVPGVGTVAALGLSGVAVVGFLEATALYAQSVAELHGISTQDPKQAEALVMAVMLGDDGRKMLKDFAGGQQGANAALGVLTAGGGMSGMMFDKLKRMFLRKMLVRQGAGLVGRAVPFGVGAVIGGVGNRAMGRGVVKAAQNLFGALPATLSAEITRTEEGKDHEETTKELEAEGQRQAEQRKKELEAELEREAAETEQSEKESESKHGS